MKDSKFTTHGDEPVEARIVAWVLGEASAFEVEELQRLCDEQPELAVFKRRIEAVHELIDEAEHPQQDAAWKLSAAKRLPIEKLLGDDDREEIMRLREQARDRSIHFSHKRMILGIAACLVMTVGVAQLTGNLFIRPTIHKEESVVVSYAYQSAPEESSDHALSKDAMRRGSIAESKKAERMVPFSSVASGSLPAELLEGTPKPVYLPNLVDGNEIASRFRQMEGSNDGKNRKSKVAKKPSSPSKSARLTASSSRSDALIPVPEVTVAPSVEFGVSQDFGTGYGGSGRAMANRSEEINGLDNPMLTSDDHALPMGLSAAPGESYSSTGQKKALAKGTTHSLDGEMWMDSDVGAHPKLRDASVNAPGKRDLSDADPFAAEREEVDRVAQTPSDAERLGMMFEAKQSAKRMAANAMDEFVTDSVTFSLDDSKDGPSHRLNDEGHDLSNTEGLEKLLMLEKFKAQEALNLSESGLDVLPPVVKQLPPVDEEIAAAQEPYSTFSLNINDVSFRMALDALMRGEQPDPAGIKVEHFYNAVDYGDPAPAAGQPVASNIEQAAHPVIPGRNLVRIAVKTAAAGRSAGQPLRLTLLADQSGSMGRADRREAMKAALDGLADLLGPQDVVNVIGFSRTPHLLAEGLNGENGEVLAGLINQEASEGGTNLEQAIKLGEQLAERHMMEGAQNRMVLFTDGAANLGDADPDSLAEKIKLLRQKGIAFDIAGIAADGLNDELLGELARHGNGRYYIVGKGGKADFAKQLAGAFRPAAENVKVQVHFNPERVGLYKLIGFEKDRLNKEDFRNDAVDAAEMAAEEAGVAIYQVEPMPEGQGEIGEISVRFRDVASGEMVERTWAIPYDSSVPSVQRARPSMQLAVLATLAGQKLKSGPLADAIDFNQFSKVQAQVRNHYGQSGPVADLLRMIDQLK